MVLPHETERVLVLDGAQRAALAVTRSLGRRRIPVFVADSERRTIGGASRYCTEHIVHASAIDHPERFVDEIASAVERFGITSVYPITDISTMLLASHRERLMPAKLCAPSADAYFAVSDKAMLVQSALRVGVPVPRSVTALSRDEISQAVEQIGFPAVLKPARSRFVLQGVVHSTSVKIAHSEADLQRILHGVRWVGHVTCLVQEFIPGHGAGVFTVFGRTGPLAWFAHRRIREMPPSGGVSVLCESAYAGRELQQHAERLLADVKWFGPAMVEFRIGPDDRPYLMEINGRLWGSLQLPIDCGVDFPWLLLRAARGEEEFGPSDYPVGKKLRWLLRDFDNLVVQLRDRRTGMRNKTKVIKDFIRSGFDPSCRQELLRSDDMIPAFREVANYVRALSPMRKLLGQ